MTRVIGLALLACTALFLVGCEWLEPTTKSPISGQQVNVAEYLAERDKAETDARTKAAEEESRDRSAARATLLKAQVNAIRASAKQDVTAAEVKAELASIQAESGATLAGLSEKAEDRNRVLTEFLDGLQRQTDNTLANLEAKQNQRLGAASAILNNPALKAAAAPFGIDTSSILSVIGLGSTGVLLARRKAVADHAYDEGAKEAHTARDKADAAFDEATTRAMALRSLPLAA